MQHGLKDRGAAVHSASCCDAPTFSREKLLGTHAQQQLAPENNFGRTYVCRDWDSLLPRADEVGAEEHMSAQLPWQLSGDQKTVAQTGCTGRVRVHSSCPRQHTKAWKIKTMVAKEPKRLFIKRFYSGTKINPSSLSRERGSGRALRIRPGLSGGGGALSELRLTRSCAKERERGWGSLVVGGVGHAFGQKFFANCAADRRQHVRVRGNFST